MPGVFDRLHNQISYDPDEPGLSVLDLADMPPAQRKIMRLMLREFEMTHEELYEAVAAWPETERMSQDELDQALDALSKNLWLIRMGEEHITYRANLRRKPGSALAKSIWANLDSKIEQSQASAPEEPDDPGS